MERWKHDRKGAEERNQSLEMIKQPAAVGKLPSLEVFLEQNGYEWSRILPVFPWIKELKAVMQDSQWHGEGNVLEHTRRVCEAVVSGQEWERLSRRDRAVLYMAAMFHDIGKQSRTKYPEGWERAEDDGEGLFKAEGKRSFNTYRIISPGHANAGAKRFRELCYRELEARFFIPFTMREEMAWLIRYHGLPQLFMEKDIPAFHLIRAAESVKLSLLYQLGRADVLGRECRDQENALETVEYFKAFAMEIGCYKGKIRFANAFTRFSYFGRQNIWHGEQLYDTTAFDVFVMAGLPLAGKDTYVAEHFAGYPVISLDDIREEMGVRPDEPSGPVAAVARERAKGYLRSRTPFVWNATNLVLENRQKVCGLCADYGARVNLIYREVPYGELLRRNTIRARSVPVDVINRMIRRMDMVECVEAYRVDYGRKEEE